MTQVVWEKIGFNPDHHPLCNEGSTAKMSHPGVFQLDIFSSQGHTVPEQD